jgi:hypothetical protein
MRCQGVRATSIGSAAHWRRTRTVPLERLHIALGEGPIKLADDGT